MTLELTAECNFDCPFCYCVWHEFPRLAEPLLDTEGWRQVIDKCAADGVKDILFTGGEALLRHDILDIVDYARIKLPKARLTLFTNASRLTETLLRAFKEKGVRLATSLQGLKTYGAMTGTRRKPNRLLRVVARAAELKWPVAVTITVTSVNRYEVVDMFSAAVVSGASFVQLEPVMAEGRTKDHLELMISRDEWRAVKEEINALPKTAVRHAFVDEFICTCRRQPAKLLAQWAESSEKTCSAGKTFGVVGPNGKYRICLHAL